MSLNVQFVSHMGEAPMSSGHGANTDSGSHQWHVLRAARGPPAAPGWTLLPWKSYTTQRLPRTDSLAEEPTREMVTRGRAAWTCPGTPRGSRSLSPWVVTVCPRHTPTCGAEPGNTDIVPSPWGRSRGGLAPVHPRSAGPPGPGAPDADTKWLLRIPPPGPRVDRAPPRAGAAWRTARAAPGQGLFVTQHGLAMQTGARL